MIRNAGRGGGKAAEKLWHGAAHFEDQHCEDQVLRMVPSLRQTPQHFAKMRSA